MSSVFAFNPGNYECFELKQGMQEFADSRRAFLVFCQDVRSSRIAGAACIPGLGIEAI